MSRRRWTLLLAAALAVTALACESGGDAQRPAPDPDRSPSGSGLPVAMAALGDSITSGFGSCLGLASCQRNSWSTGDGVRVKSHYRRLLPAAKALRNHAYNFAQPGARATDLPRQASAAVTAKADYVTILVGANDACRSRVEQMTRPEDFRDEVDRTLRVLRQGRPRARILVASIPDLYRLWEIGHTRPRTVRIWSHGICPALLANAASTARADVARRRAVRDRIDAYNDQLAAACRAYGSRCRYDNGAVHRVTFTLEMVNQLDYLHPDVDGQNKLAEVTWAVSGWANRLD